MSPPLRPAPCALERERISQGVPPDPCHPLLLTDYVGEWTWHAFWWDDEVKARSEEGEGQGLSRDAGPIWQRGSDWPLFCLALPRPSLSRDYTHPQAQLDHEAASKLYSDNDVAEA